MEQTRYERPREKLIANGAEALSLRELLQLVVGPGSVRVSGARLAREVEQLLAQGRLTYESLVTIDGLGVAKACQVLAACELSRRL